MRLLISPSESRRLSAAQREKMCCQSSPTAAASSLDAVGWRRTLACVCLVKSTIKKSAYLRRAAPPPVVFPFCVKRTIQTVHDISHSTPLCHASGGMNRPERSAPLHVGRCNCTGSDNRLAMPQCHLQAGRGIQVIENAVTICRERFACQTMYIKPLFYTVTDLFLELSPT